MKLQCLALSLLLSACATATPPALTCPTEFARYTLRGAPGATLQFSVPPHAPNAHSDLAARIDFEDESYWFVFTSSLGFSRNYIGRTDDPFEAAGREDAGEDIGQEPLEPEFDGSEYLGFDASFNVIEDLPRAGEPAPAHILANGIASSIWYSTPRRVLPKGLWDLSACAPRETASASQ